MTEFEESAEDRELLRLYREASDETLPHSVIVGVRSAWRRPRRRIAGVIAATASLAAVVALALVTFVHLKPGPTSAPLPAADISWDPPSGSIHFDTRLQVERVRLDRLSAPPCDIDRALDEVRRRIKDLAVDPMKL